MAGWHTRHDDLRLDADRLDQLWDFADPGGSAERFRAELATGPAPTASAELVTQLARALGLQGRFDEADELLDGVRAEGLLPVVEVRVALERGRLRNSSGTPVEAVPFFKQALDRAGRPARTSSRWTRRTCWPSPTRTRPRNGRGWPSA